MKSTLNLHETPNLDTGMKECTKSAFKCVQRRCGSPPVKLLNGSDIGRQNANASLHLPPSMMIKHDDNFATHQPTFFTKHRMYPPPACNSTCTPSDLFRRSQQEHQLGSMRKLLALEGNVNEMKRDRSKDTNNMSNQPKEQTSVEATESEHNSNQSKITRVSVPPNAVNGCLETNANLMQLVQKNDPLGNLRLSKEADASLPYIRQPSDCGVPQLGLESLMS